MLSVTFTLDDSGQTIEECLERWDRVPHEHGSSYVYAFRDAAGQTFYIGKGTGNRAYDRRRHRHGQLGYYVAEFLRDAYTVHILKSNLTAADAEELEDELLGRFACQLVNWRDVTTAGIEYAPVRDQVAHARQLAKAAAQSGDLERAADLCRSAVDVASEWEAADRAQRQRDLEAAAPRSLLARVQLHELLNQYVAQAPACACEALSDLTIYLCKLNRAADAQDAIDRFTLRFPHGSFLGYVLSDHRYETPIRVNPTQREQQTLRRVLKALGRKRE